MIHDPVFYALAVLGVFLLGVAKGGFTGAGALSLPMLALVISPVRAAAILLPILIAQDFVSVWSFRKTWDKHVLMVLLPSSAVGIFLAFILAKQMDANFILGVLGAISLIFATNRLWMTHKGIAQKPPAPPLIDKAQGVVAGFASGFTSQIAHAGQPPFQMWVLPKNLPPASLVGTTAIFFAAMNWLKVPAYLALGQFTPGNLATSAALMPVAIASTYAGVWIVRRLNPAKFYSLIYALMIVMGVYLLYQAITERH
jgi:uncharacterized membrane protein YfcA